MKIAALICKSATIFKEEWTDHWVSSSNNNNTVSRALHLVSSRFVNSWMGNNKNLLRTLDNRTCAPFFCICLIVDLTQAFYVVDRAIGNFPLTDACTTIVWLRHPTIEWCNPSGFLVFVHMSLYTITAAPKWELRIWGQLFRSNTFKKISIRELQTISPQLLLEEMSL